MFPIRVYYDCEFLEDGSTIELISIGMVAEDGRELYAVSEETGLDPLYGRICRHDWLMANVVPNLPLAPMRGSWPYGLRNLFNTAFFYLDDTSTAVMPRRMIRNMVREFLTATPDVELWAWYGAYDHVVLAQLFGRMIDLPTGVPMYTHDLKQEVDRLGNPRMPEQEGAEHNALADARHVKAMHEALLTAEVG